MIIGNQGDKNKDAYISVFSVYICDNKTKYAEWVSRVEYEYSQCFLA